MISNLSNLAGEMSWLRESIVSHLERMIEKLDSTELYLADNNSTQERFLKITDIAVEPIVVTQELLPIPIKFERDGKKEDKDLPKGDVLADLQADIYERPFEAEKYVKEPWSRTFAKENALVVKGEPGGGKTFLTKYTVIQIADVAINKLKNFVCPLEEIEIPLFVTANNIATNFESESQTLAQLLRKVVKAGHGDKKLIPSFYDWLETQLEKESGVTIFVDALDEIEGQNEDNFKKVATKLKGVEGKVVFTCRTMNWDTQQSLIAWNQITVVSLDQFNQNQKKEVIEKFFRKQPGKLTEFIKITESNYSLQNSFSSPLMLTFGCLLHRIDELNADTTHIQLYEKVIEKLFSGEFAPNDRKPYWTKRIDDGISPDDKTEMLMDLFDEISWQLFHQKPEAKEFSLIEWNLAFTNAVEAIKSIHPQIEKVSDSLKFRDELIKIRLLVFTKKEKGKQRWSYLHKTFLEFSAARALSIKLNWLDEAKQHFWDKNWLETLTFLAGQVKDVKPLIAAVRQEPTDIFGWKIFLEARFTGVSNLGGKDIEEICNKIIYGLYEKYCYNTAQKIERFRSTINSYLYEGFLKPAHFFLNLNSFCRRFIFDKLFLPNINFLRSDNKKSDKSDLKRNSVADALGRLGDFTPEVIKVLINALQSDKDWLVRESAAESLGRLERSSEAITKTLIHTLQFDDDFEVRIMAARSFSDLGDSSEKVITTLIHSLQFDDDYEVRINAAYSFKKLGETLSSSVIEFLILKITLQLFDRWQRSSAIIALQGANDLSEDAILTLINVLQFDRDFLARKSAAISLGNLGNSSPEIIAALTKTLLLKKAIGDEVYVHYSVTEALGKLKNASKQISPVLVNNLQFSNDRSVRWKAAEALGNLGYSSPEVITVLIYALQNDEYRNDEYWNVREAAAEALGKLGRADYKVVDALIHALQNDEDSSVRRVAAKALGEIIIDERNNFDRIKILPIIKMIFNNSEMNRYVLNQNFTIPLYQIWRFLVKDDDKLIFTSQFLENIQLPEKWENPEKPKDDNDWNFDIDDDF